MNDPQDPQDPLLLDHEADGIRELDNNLPRWWVWLFYLTIIYSVGYMGYYHVWRAGDLQAAEYEKEWKKGEEIKVASLLKFESSLDSLAPQNEPSILSSGQQIYMNMCAPCHRADGGGLVGPNFCDDFWIHGSNYVDTLKVIINGVPEKGMVAWKGMLKPGEIQAVASYIYTFRGTEVPNPKPPENTPQIETPSEFE